MNDKILYLKKAVNSLRTLSHLAFESFLKFRIGTKKFGHDCVWCNICVSSYFHSWIFPYRQLSTIACFQRQCSFYPLRKHPRRRYFRKPLHIVAKLGFFSFDFADREGWGGEGEFYLLRRSLYPQTGLPLRKHNLLIILSPNSLLCTRSSSFKSFVFL